MERVLYKLGVDSIRARRAIFPLTPRITSILLRFYALGWVSAQKLIFIFSVQINVQIYFVAQMEGPDAYNQERTKDCRRPKIVYIIRRRL